MKSQFWYAKFPGDAYALGSFQFPKPVSERTFRRFLLVWEFGKNTGRRSLPRGVQVWPTNIAGA